MFSLDDITILIVNYRTAELTARCLESILRYYPDVEIHLIDNGSHDDSSDYIRRMAARQASIDCSINPTNRYHGPALDQGLRVCRTALALTLDSDTRMVNGGLLEGMVACLNDPDVYAVGRKVLMDPFGYESPAGMPLAFESIHPACMLLRREVYLQLKPFIHHGSPGIRNMRQAGRAGYTLVDFALEDYLEHRGRGTCARYGYGLGWRHKVENMLHRGLRRLTGT
jgi:glycosyltransferase involved in cell wall biosynthesis